MSSQVRLWVASAALAAVYGLIYVSSPSYAGGDKDLKVTVKKIAEALKKGDKAGAQKLAAAAVKNADLIEEISDIMHLFRPRSKGGLGVGDKAGSNPAKDGIEIKLRDIARDGANVKEAEALETSGYWIAALSELSTAKGWDRDQGKKTKKAWTDYSNQMRDLGIVFAKAAAAKNTTDIKTAASKLNANCNNCHSIFKE